MKTRRTQSEKNLSFLGHLDFASQGLLVNIRSAFSIRKMSILTGKAILFSNKNVGIEGNISG